MTTAHYVVKVGLVGALIGCSQRPDSPRIEELPKPDSPIVAAGLVDRAPNDASPDSISLGEADTSRVVELGRGKHVVVRLNSNPSTGYRWTLIPANGAVLTPIGEPAYNSGNAPDGGVGRGGVERWSFVAAQSGQQELRFEYRRPWERNAPPAKVLRYTIAVP